jgi:shikimate kinase
MGAYLRTVRRAGGTTVVLNDQPENILQRIRFFDIDSRPIEKVLTQDEKRRYLREIKKDITYFLQSYERANLQIDISGLGANEAARKVKEALRATTMKMGQSKESEQATTPDVLITVGEQHASANQGVKKERQRAKTPFPQ